MSLVLIDHFVVEETLKLKTPNIPKQGHLPYILVMCLLSCNCYNAVTKRHVADSAINVFRNNILAATASLDTDKLRSAFRYAVTRERWSAQLSVTAIAISAER